MHRSRSALCHSGKEARGPGRTETDVVLYSSVTQKPSWSFLFHREQRYESSTPKSQTSVYSSFCLRFQTETHFTPWLCTW